MNRPAVQGRECLNEVHAIRQYVNAGLYRNAGTTEIDARA